MTGFAKRYLSHTFDVQTKCCNSWLFLGIFVSKFFLICMENCRPTIMKLWSFSVQKCLGNELSGRKEQFSLNLCASLYTHAQYLEGLGTYLLKFFLHFTCRCCGASFGSYLKIRCGCRIFLGFWTASDTFSGTIWLATFTEKTLGCIIESTKLLVMRSEALSP